jgi:hypothetical protein
MSPLKTTHLDSPDIEMALAKESSSSDTDNQSKDADTLLHMKNSSCYSSPKVDPKKNRFPFCLVWSPLPIISWFLPFIGHLGIADSKG